MCMCSHVLVHVDTVCSALHFWVSYKEAIVCEILIESETLIFFFVKWGFACKMQIEI